MRVVVHAAPAAAPPIDCFYVYPTVDLGLAPANHVEFDDLDAITSVTRAQAARFAQVCALYVPLYRQITIGTYLRGGDRERDGLALAYGDVAAAFRAYLAAHPGRRIVLLGHSQGAEMVTPAGPRALRRRPGDAGAPGRGAGDRRPRDHAVPARRRRHVRPRAAVHRARPDRLRDRLPLVSRRRGSPRAPAGAAGRTAGGVRRIPATWPIPTATATLDATYPRSRVGTGSGITTPYVSYPAQYAARCAGSSTGAPGPRDRRTRPGRAGRRSTSIVRRSARRWAPTCSTSRSREDDLVEIVRRAAAGSPPSRAPVPGSRR